MRLVVVGLLVLALARPARAGDDAPPPPHHHTGAWYGGWSLVLAGGAATLVGAALTTRDESGLPTAGWVLAGVGTATWIGGAVLLRLSGRTRRAYPIGAGGQP